MFVGRPLGLTLLQIRFFGIAAHDFAETPLYGQSFDGHFADGVDLGAHLADRLIVDAHGESGVSGFRRRTLDVERQRCAAVGQFELIKNFFLTTIAYGLLLLVYFGSKSDYLMDNINQIDVVALGVKVILFYLVMIAGL